MAQSRVGETVHACEGEIRPSPTPGGRPNPTPLLCVQQVLRTLDVTVGHATGLPQVSCFVRLDIDPKNVMWRRVVDINDR